MLTRRARLVKGCRACERRGDRAGKLRISRDDRLLVVPIPPRVSQFESARNIFEFARASQPDERISSLEGGDVITKKSKKEPRDTKSRKLQVNKETIKDLTASERSAGKVKGGQKRIISLVCETS